MKLFGITLNLKTLTKLAIAVAPLVPAIKQAVKDAKTTKA